MPAVPPVPAPVWSACERGMDAGGCRGPAVAGCGQLGARCAHHGAWRIQIRLYLYAWRILLHASPELPMPNLPLQRAPPYFDAAVRVEEVERERLY